MDREVVVPRPYKFFDWMLNSSLDLFGLHQGKKIRVTMKFEVFKRHIVMPTLPTNMVHWVLWWERQKRCSGRKKNKSPWQQIIDKLFNESFVEWIFRLLFPNERFIENWRRRQMKTKEWSTLNFSKISFFWTYITKINTFTFWCMVIPIGLHSVYTQWGAQRLSIISLRNWTMEVGPSSQTKKKGHPWSDFMVHGVNRP